MNTGVRVVLFLLALIAGLLAAAVLLDVVSVSVAKEYGLRVGGVIAVGYLVVLAGSLLMAQK